MQGMSLHSACQAAIHPISSRYREGVLVHKQYRSLSGNGGRRLGLPKNRIRHLSVRAQSDAANEGPLERIAAWWRNVTGQGSAPEKAEDNAKAKLSDAKEGAKQQETSGKQAVSKASDRAADASGSSVKPHPQVDDKKVVAASNGSKRPASVSTGTQTDPVRPAKGAEGAESASWGPPGAQTEWEDADQSGKPGILGYSIVAGLILMALVTTSFLVKGIGHVRHSRRLKSQATPATVELRESRKHKRRAQVAENTRLFADTKQEKRLLRDKESVGDPKADAQGSQKIKEAGDFKPWSKEELQDMKDAGDKEAHKLVQRSHAKGHGSKGKKERVQERQQQEAERLEAGRPRLWVPGQGWVAVDADWDQQEPAPQRQPEEPSSKGPDQARPGPAQDRARGYDADSETDGSELKAAASDEAEAGSSHAADSERGEAANQHVSDGSKHAQSAGVAIEPSQREEDEQHEGEPSRIEQGEQQKGAGVKASKQEEAAEERDREEHTETQGEAKESSDMHEGQVGSEAQQTGVSTAQHEGSGPGQEGGVSFTTSEEPVEQGAGKQQRESRRVKVHERDFRQDEEQPLPPLPSVGQIELPESAVDSATLQLSSDLSVRSLRDRASVAMRASLAAGEASHRAASYSAAASVAASKAAQSAQSAAQAASYAQRALEARSAEDLEESVLRSERARAEAEESERRAATAAALATAHQEVSASQADVAEQAAESGAPAHQNFVQSAQRRSQTAWYSARSTGEGVGHALMGYVSVLWLWLQQAWHSILGLGHRGLHSLEPAWHSIVGQGRRAVHSLQPAWHSIVGLVHRAVHHLDIAWNWMVGFVSHAYMRVQDAVRRH